MDISIITVENAYGQLVAEGYIFSVARSGFYVSEIPLANIGVIYNDLNESENTKSDNSNCNNSENIQNYFIDFVSNSTVANNFPFSTWSKLMRETMSKNKSELMTKSPSIGVYKLRCAIVDYLYEFRGMNVSQNKLL